MKQHTLLAGLVLAATASPLAAQVQLNELYVSHVGTDTQEFIELIGPAGTLLDNLYVISVEGDGAAAGTVDRVTNLTGFVMPVDGFFVIGTASVPTADVLVGASDNWENGTETIYLLSSLTPPTVGSNVSLGGGVSTLPTLGTVLDSVGLIDSGFPTTDVVFDGATIVGPDSTFFPPGAFRDADFPRGWVLATFPEFDLDAVAAPYVPRTPGAPNPPNNPWVRISEYMYNGTGGEFVEFTNTSTLAADPTGWSFDDNSDIVGTQDLTGWGSIAAGQSVILAEDSAVQFDGDWSLGGLVSIVGGLTANLGASDRINLFAPNGYVIDRLNYSHTTIVGSYQALEFSLWAPTDELGTDDVLGWVGSIPGDVQASVLSANGDLGSPGAHVAVAAAGDWFNLGLGKAGVAGTPKLIGKGTEIAGDLIELKVEDGAPLAPAVLIVGLTNLSAPFKGGTLVPTTDLLAALGTDAAGGFSLIAPFPAGFPAGFELFFQVWITDAGATFGLSATNGYRSTTP